MSLSIRTTTEPEDEEEDDWGGWVTGTAKVDDKPEVPRINQKTLKEACKKHDLYQTPYLNEKLYLHYGGFRKIEGLEEYTELRALWLQGNIISRIENIDHLKKLRCLYANYLSFNKSYHYSFFLEYY